MKKTGSEVCPKCGTKLKRKKFVYTGFRNSYEKRDVTGKPDNEVWFCSASGVVAKPLDKSVNECLSSTAGIGYLEESLICGKCGFKKIKSGD